MLRRRAVAEGPTTYGNGAMAPTTATPVTTGAPVAAAPMPVASPGRVSHGGAGTLGTVGLLTVLVGAWGGIVPFIGPLIGLHADGTRAWSWTTAHVLLFLVPGAVAVLMGLAMMTRAPAIRFGLGSGTSSFAGFMTVLCGAWFVLGPLCWPVLRGARVFVLASPFREFVYWLAYALGPGVVLAMLGGMALGLSAGRRRMAAATAVVGSTQAGVPVAA